MYTEHYYIFQGKYSTLRVLIYGKQNAVCHFHLCVASCNNYASVIHQGLPGTSVLCWISGEWEEGVWTKGDHGGQRSESPYCMGRRKCLL